MITSFIYRLNMKKVFSLIFWWIIFSSVALRVRAQDNSTCFMLDGNGKPMDLSYLCQNSSSSTNHSSVKPKKLPATKISGLHTIPIKNRINGIPVIDVKFNDKYTFAMMLDTGASGIAITREMANTLKVSHHETVIVSTPSSNHVKLSSGYVYSVQVAGLKKTNARVITAPTMDIGLLGQSFFSNYDLTIKKDVIEFRER